MLPECQQCIELRKLYAAQAARLAATEALVAAAEAWVDGLGERGPHDAKARWDGLIAAVQTYRAGAAGEGRGG